MAIFARNSDRVSHMTVRTEGHVDTCERGFRRTRGQRIRRGIKRDLKRLFLQRYAHTGNFSRACRELLVARNTVYVWLKRDKAFGARYKAVDNRLYPPWEPKASSDFEAEVRAMSDRQLMAMMTMMNRRRIRTRL